MAASSVAWCLFAQATARGVWEGLRWQWGAVVGVLLLLLGVGMGKAQAEDKDFTVFDFSGANNQAFTVPDNVCQVRAHLWGGGGGGAYCALWPWNCGSGGAGGYVEGVIPVTPEQVLTVRVGGGGGEGGSCSPGAWPGGGDACTGGCNCGGRGGGYSGIFGPDGVSQGAALAIAAGGGGGSRYANASYGGAGGGSTGGMGRTNVSNGRCNAPGGSQSAGGSYSCDYDYFWFGWRTESRAGGSGAALQGGHAYVADQYRGGGGGGGYFGGAGGSWEGGGGGGSNFVHATLESVVNSQGNVNTSGGWAQPPGTSSRFWHIDLGWGGAINQNGDPGRVVLVPVPNSCSTGPDHIRLIHSGSGLTCQPSEVTLIACADSACAQQYTDPVDIVLNPALAWVGGNQVRVEGSTTVLLRQVEPGIVRLDDDSTEVVCLVGATEQCNHTFRDSGFILQDVAALNVSGKTACQADNVVIQAVQKNDATQACVAQQGFANTSQQISFWSQYDLPATNPHNSRVTVDGVNIDGAAPGTLRTLAFDQDAKAQFSLAYPDAGRIRLHARLTGQGEQAGLIMEGSSNAFVVRPERLVLAAATPPSAGATALTAVAANAGPTWPAGELFAVTARAVASCGGNSVVTPNFQLGGIVLSHQVSLPVNGANGSLGNAASQRTININQGGEGSVDTFISEVGVFTVSGSAPAYFGQALPVDAVDVGRFVPSHFDVQMPLHGCSNAAGFTYSGQPIGLVSLVARNLQQLTTSNYHGALAKSVTLSDASSAASPGSLLQTAYPASAFNQGVAQLNDVTFAFTNPETAPYALALRVTDADARSSSSGSEASTEVRAGRVLVGTAVGSELIDLPVPLRVESWQSVNGVLQWSRETDDTCTVLNTGHAVLDTHGLTTAVTALDVLGSASLVLQAPGQSNMGGVDVEINLSTIAPWLRFDWDGNGSVDNPVGQGTFGIFPGRDAHLFWREAY